MFERSCIPRAELTCGSLPTPLEARRPGILRARAVSSACLFSGLLKCSLCGASITIVSGCSRKQPAPGTTRQPQLFIRNSTGKPVDAALRFSWRSASSTGPKNARRENGVPHSSHLPRLNTQDYTDTNRKRNLKSWFVRVIGKVAASAHTLII